MSDFAWYSRMSYSSDLTQGDLLVQCPIPFPNASMYKAILENESAVEEPVDIKPGNLVVLSQACDLVNEKVDTVVLCPYWPLTEIMKTSEYFKSKNGKESLRQGKEPAYHLLNRYTSSEIEIDYSVVDFHRIYTLPKDYLKAFSITQAHRLRLLPPYREHLSQAFARYFMRVGLPVDIDKEEIKKIALP